MKGPDLLLPKEKLDYRSRPSVWSACPSRLLLLSLSISLSLSIYLSLMLQTTNQRPTTNQPNLTLFVQTHYRCKCMNSIREGVECLQTFFLLCHFKLPSLAVNRTKKNAYVVVSFHDRVRKRLDNVRVGFER